MPYGWLTELRAVYPAFDKVTQPFLSLPLRLPRAAPTVLPGPSAVRATDSALSPTEQSQQQDKRWQPRHQVKHQEVYVLLPGSVSHGRRTHLCSVLLSIYLRGGQSHQIISIIIIIIIVIFIHSYVTDVVLQGHIGKQPQRVHEILSILPFKLTLLFRTWRASDIFPTTYISCTASIHSSAVAGSSFNHFRPLSCYHCYRDGFLLKRLGCEHKFSSCPVTAAQAAPLRRAADPPDSYSFL